MRSSEPCETTDMSLSAACLATGSHRRPSVKAVGKNANLPRSRYLGTLDQIEAGMSRSVPSAPVILWSLLDRGLADRPFALFNW